MPEARLACVADLPAILRLFAESEVSPAAEPFERAEEIWRKTMSSDSIKVFVDDAQKKMVATCMIIVAPNLLRGGQQHGFLENVVTHPNHQGLGYGRAVVSAALKYAWRANCHHVLMQSGRADPRVRTFYEGLGFMADIRVGYAALRPTNFDRNGGLEPSI